MNDTNTASQPQGFFSHIGTMPAKNCAVEPMPLMMSAADAVLSAPPMSWAAVPETIESKV